MNSETKLLSRTYIQLFVTSVIEAATSSGANPPYPFKLVVVPLVQIIAHEPIWSQVTDL